MLGELITAAAKREKERTLLPLWLAGYTVAKIKGESFISYDEFIGKTSETATPTKELTPEDIEKEFAPIIAADELRRAKNGEHI